MEDKSHDVSNSTPISSEPASRIRSRLREINLGRIEEPKRDDQNSVERNGNPTATASTGSADTENPSIRNTGDSTNPTSRYTRNAAGGRKAATNHEQTATMGEETASVETEAPKPKRGRPAGSTNRKTKGVIQPEHVEAWTVQIFSFAAMFKNAKHWAVQDPNVEVKPWAPQAAELLNKIPAKYAEQAITANAAVAVCVGIGTMVYVRTMQDHYMKMANQPARTEAPAQGTTEPTSINKQPPRRTQPGTGAGSVHPREKIEGLGEMAVF